MNSSAWSMPDLPVGWTRLVFSVWVVSRPSGVLPNMPRPQATAALTPRPASMTTAINVVRIMFASSFCSDCVVSSSRDRGRKRAVSPRRSPRLTYGSGYGFTGLGTPHFAMPTSLEIHTVVSMPFAENTYLVRRPDRDDVLVIDPGLEPEAILNVLAGNGH